MLDMWYEAGAPEKSGIPTTFHFQADNNRINKGNIRNYSWEYVEQYKVIKQFNKPLSTRSIKVFFFQRMSGQKNELYYKPQDMYATFDRDVRMLKMGKLHIGDYYINCYITSSSKDEYDNGVVIAATLTVLSDFRWHREEVIEFYADSGEPQESDWLDYEFDYQHDYYGSGQKKAFQRIQSEAIAPFDFRLEFRGYIDNPTFIIGSNVYRVLTTIQDGESLIIDSMEKRVYRRYASGDEVSEFNNRDRDFNIFEKMPSEGEDIEVVYPEGHDVILTAYLERSEPMWI